MMRLYKTPVQLIHFMVLSALLLWTAAGFAQGTPAGRVVFAMGTPQAIETAGTARNLARGDAIYSGDRLVTGRGRLQVSMADGAFISVQPNSEYVLDNYRYAGQPDGTEQAVYRLAKGGVRAVTGMIGRTNKEAYKVNTAVATIGIRGTGHNTRICAGDCAGGVKDGLYHNTWEGITYVVNDVDSEDVPAGNGVYVEDIDTEIIPLDQAPGVTAAVTETERIKEEEKEDQKEQEQTTLVATGEQRNETGDQQIVVSESRLPSAVTSGLLVGGISPDAEAMDGIGDFGLFNSSIFKDPNTNGVLGILGLDDESESGRQRTIGTINIGAVLGGDDPAAVSEAGNLLGFVDQQTKNTFLSGPAQVAESGGAGVMGWGRWGNGYILIVHADGKVELNDDLVNNHYLHYIYGPDPGTNIPVAGTAYYIFTGGTHSTLLHGSTIGNGVTSGDIYVDFGANTARLKMNVDHNGNLYLVSGLLNLDRSGYEGNGLNDIGLGVPTTTTAVGSACNPGCVTYIEGGFFGPIAASIPGNVGLLYAIQETDPIMGVAAFGYSSQIASLASKPMVMVVVQPSVSFPGQVDVTTGYNAILYANAVTGALIGGIITTDEDISPTQTIATRAFGTVDLNAMKLSNDAAANTELNNLAAQANATMVADFQSNRATVTEYASIGSVGYGRWSNGKVLTYNSNQGTEVATLTGNQSFHFIYGPDPGIIPTTGTATYTFAGGSHSTSVSGSTLGNGVTSGSINVDFLYAFANLNMVVNHINANNSGGNYNVSGQLFLDTPNGVHDSGSSIFATGGTGACSVSCPTYIDGGFAGPANTSGRPTFIGIEYDIYENDIITGVAGFKN